MLRLSRSPRALVLWTAAVIVAVVTAVVVASDLAALHRRAHELGPERTVVVARRDLPLGRTVAPGDLREREVHASQLPSGVLRSSADAVDRVVQVPVLRGSFVSARQLAPRRRQGLDGAIPRGMRAMRVVVADAVRPRAGASVDVIASFEDAASTPSEGSTDVLPATVVARGVFVIASDDARTSEGLRALGVTLLVTPREARALAFASTHGVLTIALVPPEDARRA